MRFFIPSRIFSIHLKSIFIGALLVTFALPFHAFAQKESKTFPARNAVYVEFGGGSGRYAVNYSRIIHQKEKLKLNISAGFSMWRHSIDMRAFTSTRWLPVVPLEVSAIYGNSKHHLELGVGITSYLETSLDINLDTYELSEKVVFGAALPLRVGYRYQKPGGGFFYRVGYTPFFNLPVGGRENWNFEPRFAGLSIGKSF